MTLRVVDITMKLRTWKYYISQGFRGVFKNGLMSAASIIIVSACVFTVILSLSIMVNVDYVLNQIESNVGVTVFLGNKPTDAQVKVLQKKIEEMPNVTKVTYISQQGALEKAKKMWDTDTLDGLKEDNPFPRSLDVQVSGISHQKDVIARITKLQQEFENQIVNGEVETVAETTTIDPAQAAKAAVNNAVKEAGSQPTTTKTALLDKLTGTVEVQAEGTSATPVTEGLPTPATIQQENNEPVTVNNAPKIGDADYEYQGIESIRHAQQLTDTLMAIDAIFKIVSVVIIAILAIISIGIIMNTIKLTVFIRKNEIGIMKYVGATDWFIRWPFIVEGVIIGLIGAAIPSVISWLSYDRIVDYFNTHISVLNTLMSLKSGSEIFVVTIPVALLVGALLGAVGSITSVRKHLRV
jgi:cell division protein FtsX